MNRDYSVDIAKGVGILFVVIGHCHIPIEKEIFVFHLPVFFFIAGFFFRMESYKEFAWKKFRTLLVPAAFFYLLGLVIKAPAFFARHGMEYFQGNISNTGHAFDVCHANGPVWFIFCLWTLLNIFYFLKKYALNRGYIANSLVVMAIFGGVFSGIKSD